MLPKRIRGLSQIRAIQDHLKVAIAPIPAILRTVKAPAIKVVMLIPNLFFSIVFTTFCLSCSASLADGIILT